MVGLKAHQLAVRSGSSKAGEGEMFRVSKIISHQKYNNDDYDYDFSLLKLFGKIAYNDQQRAVKLPDEDDDTNEGEFVRALGWGRTLNPAEKSDVLRAVVLMVIKPDECEEQYKYYDIKMEHNKVCAVHPERKDGKDSCQGK